MNREEKYLSVEELHDRLAGFPRLGYVKHPSPLEPLYRLTNHMGGPKLWIKRDDLVGPGMGGNKGRNLAYILAEVLRQGKRKVITYGGLQSNHARMTAAACAAEGLESHLFFFERRPPHPVGNLLLDTLFGAHMHFIPFGGSGSAALTLEATNRIVRLVSLVYVGPGAYFMPVGGHGVIGCLGFVEAAVELYEQIQALGLAPEKCVVLTATGTGGTLVGLAVGFRLLGSPIRVMGLDIGRLWRHFPRTLAHLATQTCRQLNSNTTWRPEEIPLGRHDYAGAGYAILTDEAQTAIRILARQEGILLDPVYSGKAFAGLLDLLNQKQFEPDEHVIFLHTGGIPALWAYGDDWGPY